jgi:hypothetical protein
MGIAVLGIDIGKNVCSLVSAETSAPHLAALVAEYHFFGALALAASCNKETTENSRPVVALK